MNETQLRLYPAFKALPIYDESDERAHQLASGSRDGHAVRECTRMSEVEACLKDSALVPLGGVRVGVDGRQVVVAYFGAAG